MIKHFILLAILILGITTSSSFATVVGGTVTNNNVALSNGSLSFQLFGCSNPLVNSSAGPSAKTTYSFTLDNNGNLPTAAVTGNDVIYCSGTVGTTYYELKAYNSVQGLIWDRFYRITGSIWNIGTATVLTNFGISTYLSVVPVGDQIVSTPLSNRLTLAGGPTLIQQLQIGRDPIAPNEGATKHYVDTLFGGATGTTNGIIQLTGDGTAGPGFGSQVFTLKTVNTTTGLCGDATHIPQLITNGKGLVTSCTPILANIGSSYTLPIAQPSTLGGIKPDNITLVTDPTTGITGVINTTPTGTGFIHITVGAKDSAARAINLASGDISGITGRANGGTGENSISGIRKANGTSPDTAAVGGTDYLVPGVLPNGTTATTTNALTAASSGGASPGDTFNGSAAKAWDYHTLGAAPASGSGNYVQTGVLNPGNICSGSVSTATDCVWYTWTPGSAVQFPFFTSSAGLGTGGPNIQFGSQSSLKTNLIGQTGGVGNGVAAGGAAAMYWNSSNVVGFINPVPLPAGSTVGNSGGTATHICYAGDSTSGCGSGSGTVNTGTAYSPAYYATTGTTVSSTTPFSGLSYWSTTSAPAAATSSQVLSVIGSSNITNSYLANPSTSVNGQTCTLGGTCTITASGSFSGITGGTNTSATMLIGSGASLGTTGTGAIAATSLSAVSTLPTGTLAATNGTPCDTTAAVATDAFVSNCLGYYGNINFVLNNAATGLNQSISQAANSLFGLNLNGNATSSNNYNSPQSCIAGAYWTGSASNQDYWCLHVLLGTGSNPTTNLSLVHGVTTTANSYSNAGTSGAASVTINYPVAVAGLSSSNSLNLGTGTPLAYRRGTGHYLLSSGSNSDAVLGISNTTPAGTNTLAYCMVSSLNNVGGPILSITANFYAAPSASVAIPFGTFHNNGGESFTLVQTINITPKAVSGLQTFNAGVDFPSGLTIPSTDFIGYCGSSIPGLTGAPGINQSAGPGIHYLNSAPSGATNTYTFQNLYTMELSAVIGGASPTSGNVYMVGTNGDAVDSGLAAPSSAFVGILDTQTLTNKTIDGVTPATMNFLDATSSIQTQLNSKSPAISFQTNTTANSSQITYNVINSTSNSAGFSDTVSNTSGGTVKHEIGVANAATARTTLGLTAFATKTYVANTTITVGTTTVPANSCLPSNTTYYTTTMSGLASTNAVQLTPSSDLSGVTGWAGIYSTLIFNLYPSSGTLNYQVCNQTTTNITPSASTTWNAGVI